MRHGTGNHIHEHFLLSRTPLNLKGPWSHDRFCTTSHGSALPDADAFVTHDHTVTFVIVTVEFIRNGLEYWEVVWLGVLDTGFLKFCFSLGNSNLMLGNSYGSPGHASLGSFILAKTSVRYPSPDNRGLSGSRRFVQNGVPGTEARLARSSAGKSLPAGRGHFSTQNGKTIRMCPRAKV